MRRARIPALFLILSLGLSLRPSSAASIAPPPGRNGRVPVKVGVYVTDLVGVDEVGETFRVRGYLYEQWKDSRLKYAPRGAKDTDRLCDPEKIWTPNIVMANAVNGLFKLGTNIRRHPDGTVVFWEDFEDDLTMQMTFHRFPFDEQVLPVVLQPFLDERDAVALVPDAGQTGINSQPWALLAQWKMLGMRAVPAESVLGGKGGSIPEIDFNMVIKRRYGYYIWKVFLPLFIMVIVSYCALWIKETDTAAQFSVALSAALTMIAFLFVISGSLPHLPYLTYIDAFFLIGFVFSAVTIVEIVIVHRVADGRSAKAAARIRSFSRALYPAAYLLCNAAAAWAFFGR
ncbi:MAG TPA: hypothetical protein VNH15_00445 [Elusimicrobiota bacterium]|nr:hypothetical protein [Elusimicrobiota bacterium]